VKVGYDLLVELALLQLDVTGADVIAHDQPGDMAWQIGVGHRVADGKPSPDDQPSSSS
jgi:hypothetical protein